MVEPGTTTWPELLTLLVTGVDLSGDQASWAMNRIMAGEATDAQVAGFLIALRAKGVTTEELGGIAEQMLSHARRISVPAPSLDIVGTGGDRANTVNISTMSAVVAAAAGAVIVKHGNRAASSKSGTADCLEALGVVLSLGPEKVVEVAHKVGITFCFAQDFHPSMRHVAGPRRELGVPTVFNLLGPLTNPAQPVHSAVGVADALAAPLVAGVFAARGNRAAVFRGDDGLDEITVSTTSRIWWVAQGDIDEYVIAPEDVGLARHPIEALRGADANYNAQVVRDVFAGKTGAPREAVLLNAGIALAVAAEPQVRNQADFVQALRAGIARAAEAIDSGATTARLEAWKAATREAAEQR
ncbi:anthranilate phosphoribosyltransferase [Gephyromycinifex aptenodytis]|uniref:anthranilate phosphoribosyltransferase n=1 Tax=Gephyromycinifex aptenodytis TaxID=2716227 RepID=UPI00144694AA|nr:anthranilate phosphoribosyltransferase [Gephyromycinifex aptenodytis]